MMTEATEVFRNSPDPHARHWGEKLLHLLRVTWQTCEHCPTRTKPDQKPERFAAQKRKAAKKRAFIRPIPKATTDLCPVCKTNQKNIQCKQCRQCYCKHPR